MRPPAVIHAAKFDFNDFLKQYKMVSGMGNLSSLVKMLPGEGSAPRAGAEPPPPPPPPPPHLEGSIKGSISAPAALPLRIAPGGVVKGPRRERGGACPDLQTVDQAVG